MIFFLISFNNSWDNNFKSVIPNIFICIQSANNMQLNEW